MTQGPATGGYHTSEDEHILHKLGYAQELFRGMGGFQNFAISFTIISILAGCLNSYAVGFEHGGPSSIIWGWLLVGLMAGVRAVEILSRGSLLEVVAPIGFIVLVLAQSLSCCGRAPRRRRTHRHGQAWGSPRDWLRAGPGTAAG